MISEAILIGVDLAVIVLCLISFIKYREYAAIGYLASLVIVGAVYTWILLYQPPDELRRAWVRATILLLLVDIGIWRLRFIIRQIQARRSKEDVN